MNFTREPIIETIITPKEGYKLAVHNSKGGSQEEYHVDALEVVSFGASFFFRSQERPKCFLVPVSDYEVIEVKEVRVALKNAPLERSIKIAGGREAPLRPAREAPLRAAREAPVEKEAPEGAEMPSEETGAPPEKKRERRRQRRRRGSEERVRPSAEEKHAASSPAEAAVEGGGAHEETQVSSSMFTTLLPPPPTLISQTLSRYKDMGVIESTPPAPSVKEKEHPHHKKTVEDEFLSESEPLQRVAHREDPSSIFSFFSRRRH